ncbi:MAG TPA: MFS transporter, partial [Mycobacteriales bacterium]|nr:MFS transporter [Mycobacteriales bacterium]
MTIHPPPARPDSLPRISIPGYRRGEPGFVRVSVALFAAGLAAFALLYAIQALLPELSSQFGVSPATSGLALSLTTGVLALVIIPVSSLSERYGRTRVMTASVVVAALLGLALAVCTSFWLLLALRAAQGVALAGLPATAMAYLAERIHPDSLGEAIGLYVAGNTVGGLTGRLLAGLVTDLAGWRVALVAVGGCAVTAVLVYRLALPGGGPSPRHTGDPPRHASDPSGGLRRHLADPTMRRLYLLSMLLSGQFVTVYNYLGYRLLAAPFSLPASVVGLVFVVYLA